MSNEIKSEFKEFIGTLSTEICKEVLLDDLKEVNSSFKEMKKDYKEIHDNYAENITDIESQFIELQNINKRLNEFINIINKNNNNINDSLNVIKCEHKEIIDNIIKDNKQLFNEYNIKVQTLNANERKQFISEINLNLNSNNKEYINEFKGIVNSSRLEELDKNIKATIGRVNLLDSRMKEVSRVVNNSQKVILEENNLTHIQMQRNIKDNNNLVINKIIDINNKVEEFNSGIEKRNKLIIILILIILVLCIILIFK